MKDLEITIVYNNQKIGIIIPNKIKKILTLIKKLIPEYYKTPQDKIEEIIIKIKTIKENK